MIWPKVAPSVVVGSPKLVWLKRLKYSARNCNVSLSMIGKSRAMAMSIVGVAWSCEGPLRDIAVAGRWSCGVGGGVCETGRVEPVLAVCADRAGRTAIGIGADSKVGAAAVLAGAVDIVGAGHYGQRRTAAGLEETRRLPAVDDVADNARSVVKLRERIDERNGDYISVIEVRRAMIEALEVGLKDGKDVRVDRRRWR